MASAAEDPTVASSLASLASSAAKAPSSTLPPTIEDLSGVTSPESTLMSASPSTSGRQIRDHLFSWPSNDDGQALLCEGYLRKLRGFARNRTRFFRLTVGSLSFYEEDGGRRISTISRKHITGVIDEGSTRFMIQTSRPFGASETKSMVLQAASPQVKNKWLLCLRQRDDAEGGYRSEEGTLYVEGYLVKRQSFGKFSRTRWFTLTDKYFAYFTEECGEIMAACPLDKIKVVEPKDSDHFSVVASAPWTASGSSGVVCQCDNSIVRDKWVERFRFLLAERDVKFSSLAPLPDSNMKPGESRSMFKRRNYSYDETESEGNRFITNESL